MKKVFAALTLALALVGSAFAATSTYTSEVYKYTIISPTELSFTNTTSKTDSGVEFKIQTGSGDNTNGAYLMMASTYPFAVTAEDIDKAIGAYAKTGTIGATKDYTVSGQPAKLVSVLFTNDKGDKLRFIFLVTFKGNTLYQAAFGTLVDASPDTDEVAGYLASLKLN